MRKGKKSGSIKHPGMSLLVEILLVRSSGIRKLCTFVYIVSIASAYRILLLVFIPSLLSHLLISIEVKIGLAMEIGVYGVNSPNARSSLRSNVRQIGSPRQPYSY